MSPERRTYPNRRQVKVTSESLADRAAALLDSGYRLALIAGHDDPDAFRVVYLFVAARPDRRVELVLSTSRSAPQLPSLAAISLPAGRFERELQDQFGIEGAPGQVRFSAVGESILQLKARLRLAHKGIEKQAEGRLIADALPLAEQVCGDTTVGHALAFCLAVEEARDWPVTAENQVLRAILLELERLYNHVTDIGALCDDVGHGLAIAQAQQVREQLLRINRQVTGDRLLRGVIAPGVTRVRALPDPGALIAIGSDLRQIVDLALGNSAVQDRMDGTAVLSSADARDLGALGYVARASGCDLDARRDHPFSALTAGVVSTARSTGDVLARFLTRADEIQHSVALLGQLIAVRPPLSAETTKPTWLTAGSASGVGLVEGWRGTIAHRIEFGPDSSISRWKIVDPSFFNWPALTVALADTIAPDFALTSKSFNQSDAGNNL
ncbi:formate hydrogenase [Kribbella antibiotica]|uniref:Formate hydrogenase n=1 Tax=Kribbella antibiotica TaxID=190195 RepID=A0A4R4ZWG3_9ACTN|nr:NADH-quinone oxidoreductase subunit C [Kribbella antibiotica]TDD61502.1 formate hydrogenase [Kribbella antibiotica]